MGDGVSAKITLNGRDVSQYVGIRGGKLNGLFNEAETEKYKQLVSYLYEKEYIDKGQKDMFSTFLSRFADEGCAEQKSQLQIALHLREVLVSYLESQPLEGNVSPQIKNTLTLAAELAIRFKRNERGGIKLKKDAPARTATEETNPFPIHKDLKDLALESYLNTDYKNHCKEKETEIDFAPNEAEEPEAPTIAISTVIPVNPFYEMKPEMNLVGLTPVYELDPRK